jgi:hypothetical protein
MGRNRPHLSPQEGVKVLDAPVVRGRVRRKYRTLHIRVLEPPMTAAGLGYAKALALKLAPDLFHLTAC